MIDVVIVEEDLHYVKNILNTVINKFDNLRITYIATTVKEAIQIIQNNYIDLIFLDLKLQDDTGIKIIERVNSLTNTRKPNIIIVSGDIELSNKVAKKYKDLNIINKLAKSESIYKAIYNIIYKMNYLNNEKEIKRKVMYELKMIGYNFKHKGSQYILEAIVNIYENNNVDLLDNLEENVYKHIAYKYHKNIKNIKTNIIKATNYVYLYQNSENMKKYFSLDIKVTPKLVISNVLTKLRVYD